MFNEYDKVFITGGCGFLGKKFLKKWYNKVDIIIYSRDEDKHFRLSKKYPNVKYIVGDIRDLDHMLNAAKGCNYGIFAASMKHIDKCSENPIIASEVILKGAINSRIVAEKNNFKAACFISTDKSQSPSTLYGALKMAASECFLLNESNVKLNTASYGNIFNSSGSLFVKLNGMSRGDKITLFDEEMTRFGILGEEAISIIERALFSNYCGVTYVPKLWSYKVKDVLDIYKERFGIDYDIGRPRLGEKIHEVMVPRHFINITFKDLNYFVIDNNKRYNMKPVLVDEYSSDKYLISSIDLEKFLLKHNFFTDE